MNGEAIFEINRAVSYVYQHCTIANYLFFKQQYNLIFKIWVVVSCQWRI
ncbi:hypothetical protein AsAng_0047500 [Aureispira anguillae]|uniref:Uncharacterized protein n=1 Tax=Aureispira anguillae TaxID=2864201 RepID=A0A915YJ79_9BACT|nr:hypothetical protein AsAng_0047500 [Aureispira anguillae]